MKVADLRRELECRTLSSKGLKSQLIARLTKAIKSEQEKEEIEAEKKDEEEEENKPEEEEKMEVDVKEEESKKKEEEEKKKREERDRAQRERRYALPENPAIIVHPSSTAKGGKFDCTVMSLSLLLDYRPEDNKEHSFEVSLFAELFNEMLMRDFGFLLYRTLVSAPERKEDEKKGSSSSSSSSSSSGHKESSKEDSSKKEKDEEKKDKGAEKEKGMEETEDKDKEDAQEPSSKKRKLSNDEEEKEKDKKDCKEDKKDAKEPAEKKSDKDKDSKDKEEDTKEKDREKEDSSSNDRERRRSSRDKDRDREKDRDKDRDKDKDRKRDKTKFFTCDPAVLLAFVYFDQSHTGYLLDKDVEEILHTLGLHLSRAQVKKLVQKMVSRDTLNYRKITDKPVSEDKKDSKDEDGGGEGKEAGSADKKEDGKEESGLDLETLAKGNALLLQSSKLEQPSVGESPVKSRARRDSAKSSGGDSSPPKSQSSTGLLMFKGAMLDVNSVMQRLDRSEKSRTALETKLKDLQEEMDMLKDSYSSSEKNSQKVAQELQELKKRLRDQRKATDQAETFVKKYSDILSRSKSVLGGLLTDVKEVLDTTKESSSSGSSGVKKEDAEVKVKKEMNGE